MQYIKTFKKYKKIYESLDLRTKYEKQIMGDFIECYYNDELLLEFEGYNTGVFTIANYVNQFDIDEYPEIADLNDSYTLDGEITPEELKNMIVELEEKYPKMVFVGYEMFLKKYK